MNANQDAVVETVLKAADTLLNLAEEGEPMCQDVGCAVLCGLIRDCGYELRRRAEQERALHARKVFWGTIGIRHEVDAMRASFGSD